MAKTTESTLSIRNDEHEWLLTNGLGGFSQGAVNGIPLRRYHAYLIAATTPPVGRVTVLQSCAEYLAIRTDNTEAVATHVPLSTFRFGSGVLSPEGVSHLKEFKLEHDYLLWSSKIARGSGVSPALETPALGVPGQVGDSCVWTYAPAGTGITVTKRLVLIYGENRCRIEYVITGAPAGSSILVRPFVAMRDFHALCREHAHALSSQPHSTVCGVVVREGNGNGNGNGGRGGLEAHIVAIVGEAQSGVPQPKSVTFRHEPQWWRNFAYELDKARGQDSHEDLYSPGVFEATLHAPEVGWSIEATLTNPDIRVSIKPSSRSNIKPQRTAKENEVASLKLTSDDERSIDRLLHAADQFVVVRAGRRDTVPDNNVNPNGTSIIAGYPWFSDWGRDTCISLPGLLLVGGELDKATQTLTAFASMMQDGLIPNCFDNGSGHAEYNTADASLWYLNASCELAMYLCQPLNPHSDDAMGSIARACNAIIDAYVSGTAFEIGIDHEDGLVRAGNIGTQLTWMDAKRDGVVFTPRHGKPVELSALWYSGLMRVAELLPATEESRRKYLQHLAAQCEGSFSKRFWNPETQSLFDCIVPESNGPEGHAASKQVRPNQVFATSLPYSPISLQQRIAVLSTIQKQLLTPYGLRTLAPSDPAFKPRYEGALFERDGAYHNGTVWPWLMGPYVEGLLRAGDFSQSSRQQAKSAISTLLSELKKSAEVSGSIEQLAEIYDGSEPHRPSGCPAQAWSIAELLRVFALIHFGPKTPRLDTYSTSSLAAAQKRPQTQ